MPFSSASLSQIGLIAYTGKPQAAEFAEQVKKYLVNKGVEVIEEGQRMKNAQAIVVLAGDGTVMHTAAQYAPQETPVLGVSPVRVGFLSAVDNRSVYPALDRLIAGNFLIDERMMLTVEYLYKQGQPQYFEVLNDIVIKGLTKLIDLSVKVDNDELISFAADGALVATPTGSTAYSMAVGGPIAAPKVSCLIFSAINPHSLPIPSILLNPDSKVEVELLRGQEVSLIPDGRERIQMQVGEKVKIQKSQNRARLIKFTDQDFLKILENKYHLHNRGR